MGAGTQFMPLHGEMGVPDAAAQQRHVGDDGFHKAVVAAPEHLAVRRLIHAPAGIALGVHQRRPGKSFHHQQGLPQKHGGHGVGHVKGDVGFRKGDAAVQKLLHSGHPLHRFRLQRQPEGPHPLDDAVAAEAVHHPEPGLPPADQVAAAHHVAAAPHAQKIVQHPDVLCIVV